jgi:sugar lactone lactonase YvrE
MTIAFGRARGALALAALAAGVTAAAGSGADGTVIAGLNAPRGISVAAGKALVAESGDGTLARLRGGKNQASVLATLPNAVDVALTGKGWESYVATGGLEEGTPPPTAQKLYHVSSAGRTELVADIAAYQTTDPDPYNVADSPAESNPNGLALLSHGRILVADAANNDLLLVDARGHITTLARLKPELVPFPSGYPFGPPPGTLVPAEAVPTAVAVGPDGAYYVSELKGFPFATGTSRIWRIDPGSVGATCDPAADQTGPCRTVERGFTAVLDLAFGADGTMYVLEMAKNGLGGFLVLGQNPATVVGALYAVKNGVRTELAPGSLIVPGGVAVDRDGSLLVTTGDVLGPDGGAVVRVTP